MKQQQQQKLTKRQIKKQKKDNEEIEKFCHMRDFLSIRWNNTEKIEINKRIDK